MLLSPSTTTRLRQLLAWTAAALLAQAGARLLFLVWHQQSLQSGSWSTATLLGGLLLGLRADAAVTLVLLVPVSLWRLLPELLPRRAGARVDPVVGALELGLLLGLTLLVVGDVFYYGHFADRYNLFFWEPLLAGEGETARMVLLALPAELPLTAAAAALLVAGALSTVLLLGLRRLSVRPGWRRVGYAVAAVVLLGGASGVVDSLAAQGRPFFSRHPFLNTWHDSSPAALWRSWRELAELRSDERPAASGAGAGAAAELARLLSPRTEASAGGAGLVHSTTGAGKSWLTRRPRHVVLVIMESMSAWPLDEEELEFGEAVAGSLRSLAAGGVSFTAHLAGPGGTLSNLRELLLSRPGTLRPADQDERPQDLEGPGGERNVGLPRLMAGLGYEPVFVYGGSYRWHHLYYTLPRLGFERLLGGIEAPDELAASLGMPDDELFALAGDALRRADGPLFLVVLTTTNHPPYEVPDGHRGRGIYLPPPHRHRVLDQQRLRRRLRAYQYADAALGRFVEGLRREPAVFSETLFVITGDHPFRGALRPDFERTLVEQRVPLVLYGPELLARGGERIARLTSHRDLLPTMADLLVDGPVRLRSAGRSALALPRAGSQRGAPGREVPNPAPATARAPDGGAQQVPGGDAGGADLVGLYTDPVFCGDLTCLAGRCLYRGVVFEIGPDLLLRSSGSDAGSPEGQRLMRSSRTFYGL